MQDKRTHAEAASESLAFLFLFEDCVWPVQDHAMRTYVPRSFLRKLSFISSTNQNGRDPSWTDPTGPYAPIPFPLYPLPFPLYPLPLPLYPLPLPLPIIIIILDAEAPPTKRPETESAVKLFMFPAVVGLVGNRNNVSSKRRSKAKKSRDAKRVRLFRGVSANKMSESKRFV